ncbi:MAG: hypothetical protein HUK23_06895, partial [Sphaerochaetaceae bacterium]|nr:hypothetical protein [Sphaerochaetaceae bacterium]
MSQHFKIPVLTDELLSQIMWGMENQDSVYMLNIKDCSIYSAEDDSVSPEFLVNLPPWQSSDGYQLMVSFTNACKDSSLKTKLANELETKGKGVFRRFRDALSE